jgi:HEAT repeat protein
VAAVEALGTWGGAEDVPKLIAMLEGNMIVRQAAITALGKHPDQRGAEAVAQHMSDTQTRRQAGQALRSMGAAAEAAVAPLLDHADWIVQLEAAKILGAIGTEKSIAPLEAFRANSRGSGIAEADKAIKAIRERQPDATEGE